MARTDADHLVDPGDPAASNGPSKRVVTVVAAVVGIIMIVVGVLRLFGVGAPQELVDSGEALDDTAEVVRRQAAEADVQAYVRANDPMISPDESILATCTAQDESTYSCTVMITGDGFRTDSMTVRLGMDGTWKPVER